MSSVVEGDVSAGDVSVSEMPVGLEESGADELEEDTVDGLRVCGSVSDGEDSVSSMLPRGVLGAELMGVCVGGVSGVGPRVLLLLLSGTAPLDIEGGGTDVLALSGLLVVVLDPVTTTVGTCDSDTRGCAGRGGTNTGTAQSGARAARGRAVESSRSTNFCVSKCPEVK